MDASLPQTSPSSEGLLTEPVFLSITRCIISAMRHSDVGQLERLTHRIVASSPSLAKELEGKDPGKTLLKLYHPDRLAYYQRLCDTPRDSQAKDEPEELKHIKIARDWAREKEKRGTDRFSQKAASSSSPAPSRQAYEDFYDSSDSPFGRSYDSDDFDRWSDSVYERWDQSGADLDAEEELRESLYEEYDQTHTVLSAIREAEYGSLNIEIQPHHLSGLDGDLDLSSREIDDLYGIQWCKSIVSLNLSDNQIQDPGLLADLINLEELLLAGNQIDSIRPLLKMENLRLLDLSENPVEDLELLLGLEELQVLILEQCSISFELLSQFKNKDVMVFL